VLFIGNSYTSVNDLPAMLARIAATAGVPPEISVDQVVVGGARLQDHWSTGAAQQRINERTWTHVVLQGQSVEPMLDYYNDYYDHPGEFAEVAQQFGDLIVDAGAQPTWFASWARAPGDALYATFRNSPTEMQDTLTSAYAQIAQRWPTSVLACVGEAFRLSLEQHPEIVLHQDDLSHPTVAGTYLAAITFYVALTGNPVPSASEVPEGLSPTDAALLREVARVGSACAGVRARAIIWNNGGASSFGRAGAPVSLFIYFKNLGDTAAGITDGQTLAPPFSWTTGGYPGFSGKLADDRITPPCSAVLAPKSQCAVAVTYSGEITATGLLTLNLTGAYKTALTVTLDGTTTDQPLLTIRRDPSTTRLEIPYVVALPGETAPFNLFLLNRGGALASSIAPATVFPMLLPPFSWGPDNTGAPFPGGSGTTTIDGTAYDYCTDMLDVGRECVITASFSPTAPGRRAAWFRLLYETDAGTVSVTSVVNTFAPDAGP
jgi:hypothetical protein